MFDKRGIIERLSMSEGMTVEEFLDAVSLEIENDVLVLQAKKAVARNILRKLGAWSVTIRGTRRRAYKMEHRLQVSELLQIMRSRSMDASRNLNQVLRLEREVERLKRIISDTQGYMFPESVELEINELRRKAENQ